MDPQGTFEEQCVSFRVKDRVVYPHHGAAVIEATETRQMPPDGEDREFFVLRIYNPLHAGLGIPQAPGRIVDDD